MIFIDKTRHEEDANTLIDGFIDSGWNEEESSYCGISYEQLPGDIRRFILRSQNNLCCYCLKQLTWCDLTIEHIIPDSLTVKNQMEFVRYGTYIPLLATHVIPKDQFREGQTKKETPPYPHDIAWYNLLASCNHPEHCNHKRSNQFIVPFPLDRNLAADIVYFSDGICSTPNMELLESLRILNLNHHLLKKIREIWFLLSQKRYNDMEDIRANKEGILDEISISLDPEGKGLKGTFSNEKNWNTLLSYGHFITQHVY